MSSPSIEDVFNNLNNAMTEARTRAIELNRAMQESTDDVERERLRDQRDFQMRVADQHIAHLAAQGTVMQFFTLRSNLAHVIDQLRDIGDRPSR